MEYTLEDTYETLIEAEAEQKKEIEYLLELIKNNTPKSLNQSSEPETVKMKQLNHCVKLTHNILKEESKDFPIPNTSDLHVEILSQLKKDICNLQELFEQLNLQLSDIKTDIAELQKKKIGLNQMKEAYCNATELVANRTFYHEYEISKRLFKQVKNDLYDVVDILFPDTFSFKDLLADLTSAYLKGGDDVYVDITSELHSDSIYFLLEADIISYHRNDKNRIRLIELL